MNMFELEERDIVKICNSRGLYETPSLNECLLLHNIGLSRIPLLPNYSNVTSLILENNGITLIQNLSCMPKLKYLNLNNNKINSVDFSRDFEPLTELEQIHLSSNRVSRITIPDASFGSLKILKLSKNDVTDLFDFSSFPNLEVLDLSGNRISDGSGFLEFLKDRLPRSLIQLYFSPNPFIGNVKDYRRTVVGAVSGLRFLDKAFVTPQELELATCPKHLESQIRLTHVAESDDRRRTQLKQFREFQEISIVPENPDQQLRDELTQFISVCVPLLYC